MVRAASVEPPESWYVSETLAEAIDPDGRRVILDGVAWTHVLREHPELIEAQGAILEAVGRPSRRAPDRIPGRERFYRRGLGPSLWLMVVVDFSNTPGRVVTAFAMRRPHP